MFFLTLITWIAYIVCFLFGLLCFSQGLYYIADLVEEHTLFAKKVMKVLIYSVLIIHLLMLIFERDIPFLEILIGVVAHITYLCLLPKFPFIDLTCPLAICAGAMSLVNHFAWFYHMINYAYYPYGEIIAIFVICVWMCPLAFVISLSTNEPFTYGAADDNGEGIGSGGIEQGDQRRKGINRVANLFRMLKRKQDELLPSSTPKTL